LKTHNIKRAGGVAQGVGPEFEPQYCKKNIRLIMYEDGKMRHVDTIPGMREGRIKENDGGGEFKYDNIVRTFVNVTMYSY
jgi:hypothetical protein